MKIILAPDSFKECMDAHSVCHHLRAGILKAAPSAKVISMPMADGGEGSARILCEALGLQMQAVEVSDPLARSITASYGLRADKRVAVVETAQANGLALISPGHRNPLATSTKGCGELIQHAIEAGATTIYLCIGGSSTVDGAKDLAEVFGYRFLDADGKPLAPGGGSLIHLDRILPPNTPLPEVTFRVLCDVTNPLLGRLGAARVFAPQKGATPEMVDILEAGLSRLATCIKRDLGIDCAAMPGAGAAGGMGAGMASFLGASLEPGAEVIMEAIGLDQALNMATAVFTGEGRTDSQTLQGKVPQAVASLAAARQIPVFVIAGDVCDRNVLETYEAFSEVISLRQHDEPLSESINQAADRLENTAETLTLNLLEERP